MNTRSCTIGLVAVLISITTIGSADDWPPPAVPLDKYEVSWKKNPFNLKTAAAGKSGGFASDLTLAGISKIGDGTTVLALNGKTGQYLRLNIGQENADGIEVIEIKENGNPREAEVVLRKGSSEAVLKFGDARQTTTPARRQTQTPGTEIKANSSRPQSSTKRRAEDKEPAAPSAAAKSSSGFRIPPSEENEASAEVAPRKAAEGKPESPSAPYAEPLQYGSGKAAETRRRAMNSLPQAGAANTP